MKSFAVALLVSSSVIPAALPAQQSHSKSTKKRAASSPSAFQTQVLQKLSAMQTEIEDLRGQMADKDAQIAALKRSNESSTGTQAQTASQVDALTSTTTQTAASVSGLQTSVAAVKQDTADIKSDVQQVSQQQVEIKKSVNEPVAIHYKGVTITPGGFIAGESLWRQRALNADIYTNLMPHPTAVPVRRIRANGCRRPGPQGHPC